MHTHITLHSHMLAYTVRLYSLFIRYTVCVPCHHVSRCRCEVRACVESGMRGSSAVCTFQGEFTV